MEGALSVQCTAKSKQSQQQCKRVATPGQRVCFMHGSRSLRGIASPTFKHGGYSKFLPTRMLPSYRKAVQDQSLSLFTEVALFQVRIDDLLQRVDTGECGQLWADLRKVSRQVLVARQQKDNEQVGLLLTQLFDLIEKGEADYRVWNEVIALSMKKAKVIATEHQMQVDGQQLIRLDQVLWLVAALTDAVRKIETDREKLAAIHAQFCTILPPGLLRADAETVH
jgi:hypothetical protein